MIPEATREHYATMQELQARAIALGRTGQPGSASPLLLAGFVRLQTEAAEAGATYAAMTLAEQGTYTAPAALVDPAAFAGYASDGRALASLLATPAATMTSLRVAGTPAAKAAAVGVKLMDRIMQTQIADVARQAAGADIVSRVGVGWVRMVNQPSCPRCTVQAGKWFRWNTGFLRHPNCDCVHVAARSGSTQAALDEGLITNPYDAFMSLSTEDQDRLYGKVNAAAIRDGADISQVVNARRGMTPNGNFTTEGTTRRGNAAGLLRPGQRRMTPELIYRQAKSRAEALELLEHHGYILPGGQIPSGALRGQVEGFGQLGGGGKRKGAVADITKARETGVRDPRNRNTMTAAERRLYDAEQNYLMALSGKSPYTSPGFGNTPDPYRQRLNRVGAADRPVTQTEMATAEREYRRMLATNGQRFTR
jgi:hypothetical protein